MERNFYAGGRQHDFKNKKIIWNEITAILNTLGPPRSCAKWRKFWTDILLRVRKKIVIRDSSNENITKRVEFTKDDLEILRITGGEQKLISEFRPRTLTKQASEKASNIVNYGVDDSSRGSSEFEIKNQPLSENYNDTDDNQSRNSNDDMIAVNDDQREINRDLELNEEPDIHIKHLTKTSYNEYNEYNKSDRTNYSQTNLQSNSRKRRRSITPINIYQTKKKIANKQQYFADQEWSNNFDYDEENDTQNLENEDSSTLPKNNTLPSIYNESVCKEEILSVQRETLIEIRRLGELQQETNQLLKILIEKIGHNTSNMSMEHIPQLNEGQFNDISEVIIKKEI
ncbi:uncharacterized protein DDB_G0289917-like [Condylostylus longicornis]|uniref:uncharacterized protein DDB_G0289917-like n=1 Tax=Condylostylus longicornis TaxID=2530218 RepID=UPI00244E5185|nr:uncharacterized protein DDB_G0289917-like [Condylostylus longicornis]